MGIIKKAAKAEDKIDSRKALGKEYNLSGASIARYLRLNELSDSWKRDVDNEKIGLTMAVDLSYLPKEIQKYLYQECEEMELTLKPSDAKTNEQTRKAESRDGYHLLDELGRTKNERISEYKTVS